MEKPRDSSQRCVPYLLKFHIGMFHLSCWGELPADQFAVDCAGVEEQKFNKGNKNRSSTLKWGKQRGKRIRTRGKGKKDKG